MTMRVLIFSTLKYHKTTLSFSSLLKLFICVIFSSQNTVIHGERILTSPKLTDWGSWGIWEFCPQGTFVTGMQLRTQPHQGVFRDDRGLTGIRLFCNQFAQKSEKTVIKSSVDDEGRWGKTYFCSGLMTGFQLRSEKPRSAFVDDTAGNNLRMFCDNNEISYKEGDGTWFGTWTDKQLCQRHEAVCGISTQVERGSSLDKTGLNNVMVKCCDVPHPIQNCSPTTTWQMVVSCEASLQEDKQCGYTRMMGVSFVASHANSVPLHEAQDHGLRKMITQFRSQFLNVSSEISYEVMEKDKDHYWLFSSDYIWEPQSFKKKNVIAKKGNKLTLYQIHGKCGMMEVWGSKLKLVETDIKSKHVETSFADFINENELEYYFTSS